MRETSKAKIVQIGNSRGIRIPKLMLRQCNFKDMVELEVKKDGLMIRSAIRPRQGWEKEFAVMAHAGDDKFLDDKTLASTKWEKEEWKW